MITATTNYEYLLNSTFSIQQSGTTGVVAYHFTTHPQVRIVSVNLTLSIQSRNVNSYVKGIFNNGISILSKTAKYYNDPSSVVTSDTFQGVY